MSETHLKEQVLLNEAMLNKTQIVTLSINNFCLRNLRSFETLEIF